MRIAAAFHQIDERLPAFFVFFAIVDVQCAFFDDRFGVQRFEILIQQSFFAGMLVHQRFQFGDFGLNLFVFRQLFAHAADLLRRTDQVFFGQVFVNAAEDVFDRFAADAFAQQTLEFRIRAFHFAEVRLGALQLHIEARQHGEQIERPRRHDGVAAAGRLVDVFFDDDAEPARALKLSANAFVITFHAFVAVHVAPRLLRDRRRQIGPVLALGLHQMASDAFFAENRAFVVFFVHLKRRIDEQRHPVARVEPEDPVFDAAFFDREVRFADRVLLVIANPFEDARRLHRHGHEAPRREMQIARAVAQMEHRNRFFVQFARDIAFDELLDRLVFAELHAQEIFHRLRDQIAEFAGQEFRDRTDDIDFLLFDPTVGMVEQFLREIADQIVGVAAFHQAGNDFGDVRHADHVPVIRFVAFVIDLLVAARQNLAVAFEDRAERVQNLGKHAVDPVVLTVQDFVEVFVELDHLLGAFHVGAQPVFGHFGFDVRVLFLLFGNEGTLRVAQTFVRLLFGRFDIARNPQQRLAQIFDVGLDHLEQREAFFRIDQTRHVERTLLRTQEAAADLLGETLHHLARKLLLHLDIFFARPRQECLLQFDVHADALHLDHVRVAEALAVLVTRNRFRHPGLERLQHRIRIEHQLLRETFDFFLIRRVLEHFLHLLEQAVREVGGHLLDRQHRGRSAYDVVIVVRRIRLRHLRDIRADVADIVVDREFFAGSFFFARHKVGDILRRHVHAVIVRVLQKFAFGVGRGDQMAQVKRRQRRIHGQNAAVLLLEPLAARVDIHPVIEFLERGIAVLADVFARMFAEAFVRQIDVRRKQIAQHIESVHAARAVVAFDQPADDVRDIEERTAARTAGQTRQQEHGQFLVGADR